MPRSGRPAADSRLGSLPPCGGGLGWGVNPSPGPSPEKGGEKDKGSSPPSLSGKGAGGLGCHPRLAHCPVCGNSNPTPFLRREDVPAHQNLLCPAAAAAR